MPDESTASPVSIARLEGKIDAYAAGQSARIDGLEKRVDRHDEAIDELRAAGRPARVSGWTIAAFAVAALGVVASLLGVGIALVKALTATP